MKKYLRVSLTLIAITAIISSCKKEEATTMAPPKDYSLSIKDKTYWGTLTNAGEGPQYYSVHFNANNTLLWSQLSNDYNGTWSIDKNKLTLTFTSPAVVVTATISDDNKLTALTTNTANKVNTCELVENANIPLDGTVWKGGGNFNLTTPTALQFSFLAGANVQTKVVATTYAPGSYTRSASGGSIRFYVPTVLAYVFCVITSGERMVGCYGNITFLWEMTKQ